MKKSNFFTPHKNIAGAAITLLFLMTLSFALNCFAFEDIRYDINAKFNPQEKTIIASQTLAFKNNSGRVLEEIYLRVYPNHKYSPQEKRDLYQYASYFKVDPYPDGFQEGEFEVQSVKAGDAAAAPLSYEFEGQDRTLMKVLLARPLKNGQSLRLTIGFSLKIPHRIGRYGWHNNTFALNRWYPILGVLDEDGWCKGRDYLLHMPYVSEAADYHLEIDMPQDYTLACGCDQISESERDCGRKFISCSSSRPLRELTLAISKDYHIYESDFGGIKIKSFYFRGDEERARKAAEFAADSLLYYSRLFGDYPYKQFSIAPVYLGYGGSQNAGIIFIDSRVYQMPKFLIRYFDFFVSHETGHQWWYNVVGNNEYRQLWLDEGINSYWTTRYLEEKYGPQAKIVDMPRWLEHLIPNPTFKRARVYQYKYFARKGLDQPILSDLPSFYEPSLIFTLAYGKGSAVVDMLASYIGEETLLRIMRTYFKNYRFKVANVKDFISICQEVSGKDLGWFFDEWLYKEGVCDYSLFKKRGSLVLEKLREISMPVDMKFEFKDGSQEFSSFGRGAQVQTLDIPQDKSLERAEADYDNKILDIDRINNQFPRKLDFKLVPLSHGLYEVPIFLKEDAYSWVTGPSFSQDGVGVKTSFQKPGDYIWCAATHYAPGPDNVSSFLSFKKQNFLNRFMSWGVEFFDRDSKDDEDDDLRSYKIYLKAELALGYSLFEPASHLTAFFLHNQSLGRSGFLSSKEDAANLHYRKNKESIFGLTYYLSNAGAFPDPSVGYRLTATEEIGGHILGGGDAFSRTLLEFDKYIEIMDGHKLAFRFKGGGGYPKDKYLFYLGSDRELRGYDFKEIKGSSMLMGSFEYRFPLIRGLDIRSPCNIFTMDQIQGILFFDVGCAWYNKFNEAGFKKDVGFGLRFYFNIAGAVERLALRLDIARPLNGEDRDTHVWVGINHAF